jgi:hypothetical protein
MLEIVGSPTTLSVRTGESPVVRLRITNKGDTHWLCQQHDAGWTRLGVHLHSASDLVRAIDFDWCRAGLPRDLPPGAAVDIEVPLPRIERPGAYVLAFDLVIEGVTWFADRGSPVARLPMSVE